MSDAKNIEIHLINHVWIPSEDRIWNITWDIPDDHVFNFTWTLIRIRLENPISRNLEEIILDRTFEEINQ